MSKTMLMYDDVNIALEPPGADAYAGYVDGRFKNFAELEARFPHAHLLSIAVFPSDDAACLDVEPGDATNAQVFSWFKRQLARHQYRPCVYTSASNMKAMQSTMAANGFSRASYRLWSAHYTDEAHFCAPHTCGFGDSQADGTQFTSRAMGRSLDESVIADDFFADTEPPKPPVPRPNPPLDPTKAIQPTDVFASPHYTRITLLWFGAQNVQNGYTLDVVDARTQAHVVHTDITSNEGHGTYEFGGLKPMHAYKIGIYAKPGQSGAHSQWITVMTE